MPQRKQEDLVIAGCRIRLQFIPQPDGWQVEGLIRCGIDDHSGRYRFRTPVYLHAEEAEQEALRHATAQLGDNVDRHSSRVTNWDEFARRPARRQD